MYPVSGWWKYKKGYIGKKAARYSLVVSIETPETEVDIYTPVAQEVGLVIES